jgi:hypothetical protein
LVIFSNTSATASPLLSNNNLLVSGLQFGTGTAGLTTVVNPAAGQEWGLESTGYLYNNNGKGVIVGSPTSNNVAGLLGYPYYSFIVNGRTNFVGNDNAIEIWSANVPSSGFRHNLGFTNATFTSPNYSTVEYSMINAYEYSAAAGTGNPKHLTLQNFNAASGSGNVGIGYHTSPPIEKLSVNGNIRCKSLIGTQTKWSDYVFAPNYELKSLSDVKRYIEKEKHLPNIPSEKEIVENGLNMNQTLYLIRQEEVIKQQQELLLKQQEQIDVLKKEVMKKVK